MYEFSEIETRMELANFLGISLKRLTYTLYIEKDPYRKFEIAKKNGGVREIYAPNDNLKEIQRRIAKILNRHILGIRLTKRSKVNVSHGFEEKKV